VHLPYFVVRDHVMHGGLRGSNDLYNVLYIAFAYGEATFLTLGGPNRWQGEQFSVARQIPWSPYSWAAALAICITVMAAGVMMRDDRDEDKQSIRGWLIVLGAMGCSAWCAFYAYCIWQAGLIYPTQVSLNGPFTWSFFAFWYMIKVGQHLELHLTGTDDEVD
jgi:hypothetical protein